MSSLFYDRRILADSAFGVDEFRGINEFPALIALIAMAIVMQTERAGTIHISVSEEFFTASTVTLVHSIFIDEAVFVECEEDFL